jgi:glycerophosphoryl diester phosphodiesterase
MTPFLPPRPSAPGASPIAPQPWPYPRFVAHRGAGKAAPENTLAAFRQGALHGFRMFECDVKLSADGIAFLLHDATLERTTSGRGPAGTQRWEQLAQLDAGSWHSPEFAGEGLPTLHTAARWVIGHQCLLNIEIKPVPGTDQATGRAVADAAALLWRDAAVPPLLTSFSIKALHAAKAAQPALPRGLLLDQPHPHWLALAHELECTAVVCHFRLWTGDTLRQARASGLRTLAYTVNDAAIARQLLDDGLDAVITDELQLPARVG